jgi:hypothetical protein
MSATGCSQAVHMTPRRRPTKKTDRTPVLFLMHEKIWRGKTNGQRTGAPASTGGVTSGDAVLRAPESHHAGGARDLGQSHHARGACEVSRSAIGSRFERRGILSWFSTALN